MNPAIPDSNVSCVHILLRATTFQDLAQPAEIFTASSKTRTRRHCYCSMIKACLSDGTAHAHLRWFPNCLEFIFGMAFNLRQSNLLLLLVTHLLHLQLQPEYAI